MATKKTSQLKNGLSHQTIDPSIQDHSSFKVENIVKLTPTCPRCKGQDQLTVKIGEFKCKSCGLNHAVGY